MTSPKKHRVRKWFLIYMLVGVVVTLFLSPVDIGFSTLRVQNQLPFEVLFRCWIEKPENVVWEARVQADATVDCKIESGEPPRERPPTHGYGYTWLHELTGERVDRLIAAPKDFSQSSAGCFAHRTMLFVLTENDIVAVSPIERVEETGLNYVVGEHNSSGQ